MLRAKSITVAHILAGALLLLIPAAINGYPFIFYDTAHYIQLGAAILEAAHLHLPLLQAPDGGAAAELAQGHAHMSLTYIGGRSPFYALFATVPVGLAGFWPLALAQALVASWLAWTTAAALHGPDPARPFYAMALVLAGLSSLPFFAALAMPDVFAGLGMVAVLLLTAGPRYRWPQRSALAAIVAFAAAAHATILLLLALTAAISALFFHRQGEPPGLNLRRHALPLAALAVAIAAGAGFQLACLTAFGERPHAPPYLMARVLADGTGRAYLPTACPTPDALAICAFRNRPLDQSDDILWSDDPATGVYALADYATRLRLLREQPSFVLGALAHAPGLAATAALANWRDQLLNFTIAQDIGATRASWDTLVADAVPGAAPAVTASLSYAGTMPFALIDAADTATLAAAIAFLAFRLTRPDVRHGWRSPVPGAHGLASLAAGLAIIVAANAALCGILSEPSERYEARLIWLVPALAVFVTERVGLGVPAWRPTRLAAS